MSPLTQRARAATVVGLHGRGDAADALEIPGGGGGEAGLDDVNAQFLQLPGDLNLLRQVQIDARGLFAVAQSGIEDDDLVIHGSFSSSEIV